MERETFVGAAGRHGIEASTAAALYDDLYSSGADSEQPQLLSRDSRAFTAQSSLSRLVQVLIWLGTLLVIGAHAWWSTQGYEALGIGIVLALTLVWQIGFLAAAEWANRRDYRLLVAGFASIVAFYTPLTVYSFERLFGVDFKSDDFEDFYPYVSGGWVWMELTSIVVAALLLLRYRRPFLMVPLTLFAGFMAMDAATRALGGWDERTAVDVVVFACGIGMVAVGVVLDYRGWRRFAFWPHLAAAWLVGWSFGLLCDGRFSLAFGLSAAVAIALGVWLARLTYLAIGGVYGWAAVGVSAHGAALPFLLMAGGIGFIGLAIWLARADSPIRRRLAARGLPAPQRDLAY